MRKSICFTALAAILLVMLSLVSCKGEPAEKFSVNFIVEGTEYASIATAGEERISIPVSPSKDYYTFGGWYRDKDVWNDKFTADSLLDEKLTADISVYARFIPVEYKATFKAGNTVVAEIPFTVETKSITAPTVPAHSGYRGTWESFTLGTENITVNAVYTAIPYTITYNNVNGAINENITSYTVEEQNILLVDAIKDNHTFKGWYSDPEFNNRVTEIAVENMANIQLYAKWREGIEISTAEQLKNIRLNGRYILTGDIDLGGAEWTPIGTVDSPFTGSLDGDGYKITNFKITTGMQFVGLFGLSSGTLLNLGVEDFEIDVTYSDSSYAGGLVGYNSRGTIINCYATGDVSATSSCSISSSAGGLVGYNNYGEITNCYATGDVSATSSTSSSSYSRAGGLVGRNYYGTISNCYATGYVSATNSSYAGGLVGENYVGTITNCYATGDVSATSSNYSYAGGLVGYNYGEITNCYATGGVSATSSRNNCAGGLVGYNYEGTITNCYATGDVSASSTSSSSYAGGLAGYNIYGTITNCYRYSEQSFTVTEDGTTAYSATNTKGTAKTMEELLSVSFQTETLGWSADDWTFTEGEHPVLKNVGLTE